MELRELNADERLALAALMEFVVLASGHVTEDEEREIQAVIDEIGADVYRQAVEEVDRRFPDEEAAKKFLETITRPEARDLIFGAVTGVAMTDTMEGHESRILDWVAQHWKIEVKYGEPPAD